MQSCKTGSTIYLLYRPLPVYEKNLSQENRKFIKFYRLWTYIFILFHIFIIFFAFYNT